MLLFHYTWEPEYIEKADAVYYSYTYSYGEEVDSSIKDSINTHISQFTNPDGNPKFLLTNTGVETDVNFELEIRRSTETSVDVLEKYLFVGNYYNQSDVIEYAEICEINLVVPLDIEELLAEHLRGCNSVNIDTYTSVEELTSSLERNESIGLIKESDLHSKLQLYTLDGEDYPLESDWASRLYLAPVINSNEDVPEALLDGIWEVDRADFTEYESLRMTGVTALSRNLAILMERSSDWDYPAADIGAFLSAADITHTSNEVSFLDGCIPEQSLRFCAHPKYFETLTSSGFDVIELTGNHNKDFGEQSFIYTDGLYKENGIETYGGGLNDVDAMEPYLTSLGDTKVALLGYNQFNTTVAREALASEGNAGANPFSLEAVGRDIDQLREEGYETIIVTIQYEECYAYPTEAVIYPYCYEPLDRPDQTSDFRAVIDAGADIVIGTQAHQPQAYEIYNEGFIFYGLGNLYFDQVVWPGTRQGLVLTHYFGDGVHLQTRITTTLIDGKMQPYITTGSEREELLQYLYIARPE